MTRTNRRLPLALLGILMVASAQGTGADRQASAGESLRYRILVAEDARATTPDGLAPILEGLASSDSQIVRVAVRAAGRLERPAFIPELTKALSSTDPAVRAEAANGLGQTASGAVDAVAVALRARLAIESDPAVIGVICQTIGRLPFRTGDERRATEPVIVKALDRANASSAARLGAVRGLESLIRGARGSGFAAAPSTVQLLRILVLAADRATTGEQEAQIRRVALTALNTTGFVDATYERAMLDRDPQVRRLAVAGMSANAASDIRAGILAKGLADRDPMVRYEALRVHGRSMAANDCSAQIAATGDANPHVALLAIDQLATACPGDATATRALEAIAFEKGASPTVRLAVEQRGTDWHRPAHAIVSLVRRAPDSGDWQARLEILLNHPVAQVRAYAASAAEFVKDAGSSTTHQAAGTLLARFAADSDANVRETALTALARVRSTGADAVFISALDRPDYQVAIAACHARATLAAIEGEPEALLRALKTITARHEDTSRDARVAILARLRDVASSAQAEDLRPYLSDFDPNIATLTAQILTKITGQPHQARTTSVTPLALPPEKALLGLPATLRITMAGGRSFDVRLYVEETPITVWRIVRLAAAGYYNGLTFHRIVPNFVIQGGSPGANEYVGDGPFMRDETSLKSNLRGTIGISTRGRDTGDAQFYINTVDSPRLDHVYPVFGEVVSGMDVVDLISEGDRIQRIDLLKK